jgi:hypothetical protein
LIVKRIEKDAKVIFPKNLIALGDRGANLVRIVVGMNSKVKEFRVITHIDDGWLGGFGVVARVGLVEVFENYC